MAFFIAIFEPNIKHMAISSNDIKIRYVIDTTELSKAQQGFDKITAEEQDAIRELKKFNSELNKTSSNASDAGSKMSGAFKQAGGGIDGFLKNLGPIGPAIAGAFSIQAVIGFAQSVFKVTAEFEKLSAVLKNTLGSGAAANIALDNIKEFAKQTPFSVQQITDTFIKLANRGIKPTNAQLTNLGDLASVLGKDMNTVVEAVLDVTNTERWNELGIKVKTSGDKISGTFKGVTVEVDRTEQGALKMIETFGQLEGVSGSMAAVSETLGGKVNNLGDAWDGFLNQIGTLLAPTLQSALELTSDFMAGINAIFSVGKNEAKKNADLEVESYKGAKGRIAKLTDEQLQAELKGNNAKLKSLNTVATEYDKTTKTISKYSMLVKVSTLGLIDLSAAQTVRAFTSGKEAKAAKEQKAALDGVNGAIKEELKLREDQKRKAEEAAKPKPEKAKKTKTKEEDPLKKVKEQYQAEVKAAEMSRDLEKLQAELDGKGKADMLAIEAYHQEELIRIKEKYLKKGVGLTEADIEKQKLLFRNAVKDAEDQDQKDRQDQLDAQKKANDEKLKEEQKTLEDLAKLREKAAQSEVQWELKLREKAEKEKQDKIEATFQLTSTLMEGFSSMYQTSINNEIAAMNKRYDNEVALAEGNEQKIQEINNRRAEQEKQLKTKAFQAEQAAAIARVIFETASIIAKWSSNPVTLPLAALTLANQAAQIGFILAQPVPEFAEGTKGKAFEGGRAMVGERGIEKVVTASGKVYFTPPTATLVDLPKGSQVIPNHALSKQELFYASRYNGGSQASNPMYGKLDELGSILKGLPITQLNMDEKGFEKYIRTERRTTKILNNRFRS